MRKKYYHCKLIPNDEQDIKTYEKPIEKWGNYQPLSGYLDVAMYGKDVGNRWRLVVPYASNKTEFSVGDLLYLDDVEPDLTKENGVGANAVITAVLKGFTAINIEIESVIPRL